jgi:hypothetical protein
MFLGVAELQQAKAQSDIWNCNRCGRRVWDSDSGRPRPAVCPYCSGGGSVGGTMQQQMIQGFGSAFQQGIQQGIAAQQEAARRAAEKAAAAEKRRQEILLQAAEEARVNWQAQDVANMAAFGEILSSKKKTGGGMSSLLMKQAQQSSGAWNDPNVVDLSDTTSRIPQIPGSGAVATPFGDALISLGADTGSVFQTEQLPGAWNDSSVVDLRDTTNRIPQIPGMGEAAPLDNPLPGGPIHESDLHPLVEMSDEQLEKKETALKKAVANIHKLMDQNTKEYEEITRDAQAGMDVAWGVLFDAATTVAFGKLQGMAAQKVGGPFNAYINLPGGTAAKKDAMREVIRARETVKAAGAGKDYIDLAMVVTNNPEEKLVTAVTAAGSAMIDSRVVETFTGKLIIKSPIGVVPGVVKTGLDTGWVWSDYLMLKQQSDRREKLQKQYNDALIHLSFEQAAVIEEQKRRKTGP